MSTPCRIIVRIDKSDINKTKRFDCTWPVNPIPYGEWIDRDKEGYIYRNEVNKTCVCEDIKLGGEYIGVYCHWDGNTQTTGKILKKQFNTYEKALNLVIGGDISGLSCGVLKHYANRKGQPWTVIQPKQGTLEDVRGNIYGCYEHIFENGKWHSKKC